MANIRRNFRTLCNLMLLTFFSCNSHESKVIEQKSRIINNNIQNGIKKYIEHSANVKVKPKAILIKSYNTLGDTDNYLISTIVYRAELEKHPSDFAIIDGVPIFVFCNFSMFYNIDSVRLSTSNTAIKKYLDNREIPSTHNPIVWKLSLIKDSIFIDSSWGTNFSNSTIITPQEKFNPPPIK